MYSFGPGALRALVLSLFLSLAPHQSIAGEGNARPVDSGDVPVAISADLGTVLVTDSFSRGLSLVSTDTGSRTVVSSGVNAGTYATLSPDGRYVCYKAFESGNDGALLQVPTLYDTNTGENIALAAPSPLAGTPAVSASGAIAFTVGDVLHLVASDLSPVATHNLGQHVNLVSISPDAKQVSFAREDGSVSVVNLAAGTETTVTQGSSYYQAQFSPNGDKLLLAAADGSASIATPDGAGDIKHLGKGQAPAWIDNEHVAIVRKKAGDGAASLETILESVPAAVNGSSARLLTERGNSKIAAGPGGIAINRGGKLAFGILRSNETAITEVPDGHGGAALASSVMTAQTQTVIDTGSTVEIQGIPYLHQVYDTSDTWNGHSSCNAASALMCIQYYGILPDHPMTCSTPYVHTHNFGWYVNAQYSFNGKTYNIGSRDPNRRMGYGGFGYITQNNWENTKDHMAEYISYHGPSSSVDWSPTIAKAKADVDASNPFVVLNSMTDAGHYIVLNGYHKTQNTFVFVDCYGNKNQGYHNYNGQRALYDWPGYNNGYQNLVIAHCFIYARLVAPAAPAQLVATQASATQVNLTWNDNNMNEANYVVARSTTSGGPYTNIATLPMNSAAYSDSGLTGAPGSYYYVVRGTNARGASANSNEANTGQAPPPPPPADIIVDNADAGFTASSNWSTDTKASGRYGTNVRIRSTGAVSDAATWTFTVPEGRNYEIYAWWPAAKTRSDAAPYIMPDGAVVNRNQKTNGGTWNSLGIKTLTAGTHTVRLSCWTNTNNNTVAADAIKVVAR